MVDVLNQYIEEQFTKAEEEDTKISAEEKDVVDERTVRKTKAKLLLLFIPLTIVDTVVETELTSMPLRIE